MTMENVNHQGLKLQDYELTERLGERSSNSAVYAARQEGNEVRVLLHNTSNSTVLRHRT